MTNLTALVGELEAMLAKATPGPWRVSESGATIRAARQYKPEFGPSTTVETRLAFGYDGNSTRRTADFILIGAAVNALPTLLATLKAQREALEELLDGDIDVSGTALILHRNSDEARAIVRRARASIEGNPTA